MTSNPVIPEEDWAILSPNAKAAILFPDVSTKPLTEEELKHLEEIDISEEPTFNDLQNG